MSYPYRIQASNGQSVVTASKHEFLHQDNSLLEDLTALKVSGNLVNGHLLKFDGDNLTYIDSSNFLESTALDNITNIVDVINGNYATGSDLTNLGNTVSNHENRLLYIEGDYIQSSTFSPVLGDVSSLQTSVVDLENSRATTGQLADLDDALSTNLNNAIADVQSSIGGLDTRLDAVETASNGFASSTDLDDYMPKSNGIMSNPTVNKLSFSNINSLSGYGSFYEESVYSYYSQFPGGVVLKTLEFNENDNNRRYYVDMTYSIVNDSNISVTYNLLCWLSKLNSDGAYVSTGSSSVQLKSASMSGNTVIPMRDLSSSARFEVSEDTIPSTNLVAYGGLSDGASQIFINLKLTTFN